ncbi:coadhesin [Nematostella vectensis]|uniref:coadhesin n=1 Tax=Nematostella vectensis TaxID=45351 RepID=UPI00207727DC|nr:coadhesin [Nematostella vectensis]
MAIPMAIRKSNLTCTLVVVALLLGLAFIAFEKATIAGGFSQWSGWSQCSESCGQGLRGRARVCNNPAPGRLGEHCAGKDHEIEQCGERHCPMNGGYTEWSEYSKCDKSCGGGVRTRSRYCINPTPRHGGKDCEHGFSHVENMSCNRIRCPSPETSATVLADSGGGYGKWTNYGVCIANSGNCGEGKRTRTRVCNNPGGKGCEGPDSESMKCQIRCP